MTIYVCRSFAEIDTGKFSEMVERGFGGRTLCGDYFDKISPNYVVLDTEGEAGEIYVGGAVVERPPMPAGVHFDYMDKLVVVPERQGNGRGRAIFNRVQMESPELCWRARDGNPWLEWYKGIADDRTQDSQWHIFWRGLYGGSRDAAVNYAATKPETLSPPANGIIPVTNGILLPGEMGEFPGT